MKSVLNYFVRKAFGFKSTATAEDKTLFGHLLRIRQNIQGVYDWLYGRLSAEHLPKRMPMTEAVTSADGHEVHIAKAWNSDNLLAHLRLLDGRKISNGYQDGTPADDGLPDGVSLARLYADESVEVKALVDDNVNWDMKEFWIYGTFKNLNRLVLNCRTAIAPKKENQTPWVGMVSEEPIRFPYLEHITGGYYHNTLFNVTTPLLDLPELIDTTQCRFGGAYDAINMPKFKRVLDNWSYQDLISSSTIEHVELPSFEGYSFFNGYYNTAMIRCAKVKTISLPSAKDIYHIQNFKLAVDCPELEEIYLPSLTHKQWNVAINCPSLKKIVFGKVEVFKQGTIGGGCTDAEFYNTPNLLHIEFAEGTKGNIDLGNWSPTLDSSNLSLFLDNFLHFIAERVAEGNYTLTLSAAVYAALEEQEGQTILALLNTKGWTVASA